MAPMATRVRAWLAAAASRHPAPSAQRPNAIAFSPSPSSSYVLASRLAMSAASGWLRSSFRASPSAWLNSRSASASRPAENAIVPSTQLRSGDGAVSSTAGRNARPRDSSASTRCIAAVSSRRSRSARAGEMSEAHRRRVAASASRPAAASPAASCSSSAASPSSGCSSAATRCSHDAAWPTTSAARACSTRRRVGVMPA